MYGHHYAVKNPRVSAQLKPDKTAEVCRSIQKNNNNPVFIKDCIRDIQYVCMRVLTNMS